ncbi:PIN domain-containing protein [Streptomyces sp. NPDC091377]|uniref:PIN domain-containing protein n=1 Tax=Streptomyces sp. NPDC091377 TaxID=3365995 RepID=UPI003808E207
MIVLDSNQLRFVLPHSPALRLFSAVAERAGHTFATTDTVIREVVRQRREELEGALAAFVKSKREVNRLLSPGKRMSAVNFPDRLRALKIKEAIAEFEDDVRDTFQVLATAPEDAVVALEMEADQRPPCNNGTRARDAVIWLTAARACRSPESDASSRPLPVIFVYQDKDFRGPGKAAGLAPELVNEDTEAGRLLVLPTVLAAMDALGYPQKFADAEEITAGEGFQQALLDAVIRSTPFPSRQLAQIEEGDVTVRFNGDGKARQCLGDGTKLTSIAGTWSVRVVTERPPRRPDGQGRGYRGFPMAVEGAALMVEDRGLPTAIDFVPQSVHLPWA